LNSGVSLSLAGFLVAWGGIEPPTQGFSTLIDRFVFVQNQAASRLKTFGVREIVF
jgi:hypothetical protein